MRVCFAVFEIRWATKGVVNGLSWVNIPDMERAMSMLRKAPRSRNAEEIEWFSCAYPEKKST